MHITGSSNKSTASWESENNVVKWNIYCFKLSEWVVGHRAYLNEAGVVVSANILLVLTVRQYVLVRRRFR